MIIIATIVSQKYDLPDIYVDEIQKIEELKLKGAARTTSGTITPPYVSSSSGNTYDVSIGTGIPAYDAHIINKGEQGLLYWLMLPSVCGDYIVSAKDFNGVIHSINLSSGDYILSTDDYYKRKLIVSTGHNTNAIILPSSYLEFTIINLDSTNPVLVKKSGGTPIIIPPNASCDVIYNGTQYVYANSYINTGWLSIVGAVTYNSVDDPTGVIDIVGDYSGILTAGKRLKFTNNGNTIYGIVSVDSVYSASKTTVTFLHEIDPSDNLALNLMANSAITDVYYSNVKYPQGFPVNPDKWSVKIVDTSNRYGTPTAGTWWSPGVSLLVPAGLWDIQYACKAKAAHNSTAMGWIGARTTLSASLNSETDNRFTISGGIDYPGSGIWGYSGGHTARATVNVTEKTRLYLLHRAEAPGTLLNVTGLQGTEGASIIIATCALL